jgi:MEMO1 family protein
VAPVSDIRPSPIAGKWYPNHPDLLAQNVDGYLTSARLPSLTGEVIAVVAPHAGYRFSGPIAGHAFAAVRSQQPDLAAVITPMHHPHPARLLTSGHQAYATPLGVVEIDRQAVSELDEDLEKALGFGLTPVWEDPEHSLEIELPFLQRTLPAGFRLLPVMLRDQTPPTARQLGLSLARVLRSRRALLVASTDLSHFYPQEIALQLDGEILRRVKNLDPAGILQVEEEGKGFACGIGALAAVLWAARELGATRVEILSHGTSGDVSGLYDQVVGYAAAVCLR